MRHQEKKYRVDDFHAIEAKLHQVRAKKLNETVSTHYYTHQQTNDVVKLVQYADRNEIHILEESNGKFTLKENIPVESREAGLKWLRGQGYEVVDVVRMAYTDYQYRGGIVGLYVINDFLHSVILDFPEEQGQEIEQEFHLAQAELISIPYNKYLERIGKLESIATSQP